MDSTTASPGAPGAEARPPKLLEQLRTHLRTRHYSIRTETAYIDWVRRFILYHNKRHPREMGADEVGAFLSHLAVDRQVSASTQNQAKAALLYLYKQVLGVDLPWLDEVVQAKRGQRLPVVLTPSEVRGLMLHVEGVAGLIAQLLYGTGMRLMEGVRLRIKDVDFDRHVIIVREAKWLLNVRQNHALGIELFDHGQCLFKGCFALHDGMFGRYKPLACEWMQFGNAHRQNRQINSAHPFRRNPAHQFVHSD